MIYITGGMFQGKAAFAKDLLQKGSGSNPVILDGNDCSENALSEADLLTNLHLYLKRFPQKGLDAETFAEEISSDNPELIITAGELGCGIVPMDPEDREWRERCGRVGCALAEKSSAVYRLQCGIAQRIK